MTAPEVPPEIWVQIISQLQKPIPKVLSNPPRSLLRQQGLCSTSLVCKMFHEISTKLLYTDIVCDNFPLLFNTLESPTSNMDRFKLHTRTLRIEYPDYTLEPHYERLMRGDRVQGKSTDWPLYGVSKGLLESLSAARDVIMIYECLSWCIKRKMRYFLPLLRTIAVSSLYTADDLWSSIEELNKGIKSRIHSCVGIFENFLMSGDLEHVCTRDYTLGPFSHSAKSYVSRDHPPPNSGKYDYIRHFHMGENSKRVPCPIGVPFRLVSEFPSDRDSAEMIEDLVVGFTEGVKNRYPTTPGKAHLNTVNFEIYLSSSNYDDTEIDPFSARLQDPPVNFKSLPNNPDIPWSVAKQRVVTSLVGGALQKHLREQNKMPDMIRWLPTADAPPCPCCGSVPPR